MTLLAELKQRKLVQWALAYSAAAFALLQGIDIFAQRFGWPETIERGLLVAVCVGFFVTLLLAWYHGERGAQKVSSTELTLLAFLLAIGAGLMWHFAPNPPTAAVATKTGPANADRVHGGAGASPTSDKSIAVLPFENLSADKDNEYFASGMQDMILTKLADIGDLKVVSRTSTAKYASHPDDLKSIAQQLDVANILEGSVQKAGSRVLINVQLIDVATDRHLWAQAYTRTLDDIFGVEGEVATMIAEALRARLTQEQTLAVTTVPTRNPQAYDDYLRGQHYVDEASRGSTVADWARAIAAFEKAVAQDPGFALAWASLSSARSGGRFTSMDRTADNLRAAEESAQRALALAPNLPEAHLAMASVYRFRHHDFKAALDEAQRALQLRPNYASAYTHLGIFESHLGNWDAAIRAIDGAAVLDPQNPSSAYTQGIAHLFMGDYAIARKAFEHALAIDPQFVDVHARLSQVAILADGDIDAAVKVLDSMVPGTPPSRAVEMQRIDLLLYRRDFAAARALAARLSEKFGDSAAVDTAMHRGDIEWLDGRQDQARVFYKVAVDLLQKPASDITFADHADLALAYARMGRTDEAVRESDAAATLAHGASDLSGEAQILPGLAAAQLALGHASAAIDLLGQVLARPATGYISPARLRLDPTWDPIRHDPRFEALLKPRSKTADTPNASGASPG